MEKDRLSEWFVPKFGSKNFRIIVGILFLPYTGMVISFAVWGSLSVEFNLDKLLSICVLYFCAIGISGHCLDALGSKKKPWGNISKRNLWTASIISLIVAILIGMYYVFSGSYWLFLIGIIEIFFLLAYNLELFQGKFHNNASFVISWGILPVFAGATIQSNFVTLETIIYAVISASASYILIVTSKKYKILKQNNASYDLFYKKEIILKSITSIVVILTVIIFITKYL
ncbi:MAG: hypothetical protein CK527_01230 [Nitrosarchaeum sp.]|nr:hypothetical protein [Nitrosarchaeum sp.]PHY10015.1 MAG: hypothetical protein CK527_01230 [Nitrosarchaeum sp.]